jgi:hypothetical protein
MSNSKFMEQVQEQINLISAGKNSVQVTLLNIRTMKHGYNKNNLVCLMAIFPPVLNEIAERVAKGHASGDLPLKAKLELIKGTCKEFNELLSAFVHALDE